MSEEYLYIKILSIAYISLVFITNNICLFPINTSILDIPRIRSYLKTASNI